MTDETARWGELQEIFLAAREVEGAARERLLALRCGGDGALLERLRSLLAADREEGVLDALAPRLRPLAELLSGPPLNRIGPYRIVRELGRGGMGVVYLAERVDGQFQQRIALKLIGSTDPDPELVERLRAERQILAGLQHPNIGRLLDGGVTANGQPYLALEYIDGLPITEYCDRHRLGIEQRLRLFSDVCAAVQHAHQNLVIHRDLKPSNILVTADARVHLLDFGIAKLLNPALSSAGAPATRFDLRLMTPEYASPEQLRGETLTTATDIYSLGVLLYRLLTGSSPHRITTGAPAEVLAAVCERDPERPSTRVQRTETRAPDDVGEPLTPEQRSFVRATSLERLRRRLRGDLDSIVMMALRKEPHRRYASADLLRDDLERCLQSLPVLAHQGSWRYRAGKFLRRHRVEAAAAAVVALSLVGGLGAALSQERRATRERDRAEQALAQSEGVTEFLMDLFRSADGESAGEAPAAEVTALDLLRRGTLRADQLAAQPLVHARLLDVIGRMHIHLGRFEQAQPLLEQAVAIRRNAPGASATELASSLIHLSWVYRNRAQPERARGLVAEALRLRTAALPADHPDLAAAYYELGWLARGQEQERLYRDAIAALERSGAAPDLRLEVQQALATNLRRQGRLAAAVAAAREAVRVAERVLGAEHHGTGLAMIHLGDHVRDIEEDYEAAGRLYQRGLELLGRRYGEHSVRLLHGLNSTATLEAQRGRHADAERLARRALAIRVGATGTEHPSAAEQLHLLADILAGQGRLAEAEAVARRALEGTRRALGERHPAVLNSRLPLLARILELRGRQADADAIFRELVRPGGAESIALGQIHRQYGRVLLQRGNLREAEAQLLASLPVLRAGYGRNDHPDVQETMRALAELYRRRGEPERAAQYRVPPGRFISY